MNRGRRLATILLLPVLLLGLVPSLVEAEDCGWLNTTEIDRVFPTMAPWKVMTGGSFGSCRFTSRPGEPVSLFSANQVVLPSEQEAAAYVLSLKSESAKTAEVIAMPSLGEHGYAQLTGPPTGAGGAPRSASYFGHRGTVAVIGSLNLQQGVSAEALETGARLVGFALAVAGDEQALAGASDCPWLDPPSVAKALLGGGVRQQVFGETSCMAQDDANGVLLVSVTELSPVLLERREASCTWEEVEPLGPGAAIGYACSEGNPRAVLRVAFGDRFVEYSLVPGGEPTADQRRALIELAVAVGERAR